jgi:signal transduction histidine kinase
MHGPDCSSIPIELLHKLLSESNISRLLETLTTFVESQFPDVQAVLFTFDSDRNILIPGSCPSLQIPNPDPERGLPVGSDKSPSCRAAFQKKAILVPDIQLDEGEFSPDDFAKVTDVHGTLAFPILSTKQELLGVFSFYYKKVLTEMPEESRFFETLTNLAAVTLERYSSQRRTKSILNELQSSQERLNLALKAQGMGVWDWSIPVDRLVWDETILDIAGLSSNDVHGTVADFERVIHPDDTEPTIAAIQKGLKENLPFEHQFRILRKGEIRYISAVGNVARDENGEPIRMTGLAWDVTDKVIAFKKLEQEKAKAVANAKMASLGEMASGVAHEINNPLTIILNRANQLKARLSNEQFDKEWAAQELVKIENTVERIAKIIRGLRAFSRNSDSDPMISCEFNSILDETLELCREKFKRFGITFSIRGFQTPVTLNCRPSQIAQVLLNLFNNSFDAIVNSQDPWIELHIFLNKETICLRVTDSGFGIPTQIADRMMDPFFSTKEVGRGTGLGLSISRGIIEEHGGRIWLDRENPHTSFVIELPAEELSHSVAAKPKAFFQKTTKQVSTSATQKQ